MSAVTSAGKLVAIEGIDGAGKSTVIGKLEACLAEDGHSLVTLREPGGVETSEKIRELVANPKLNIDPVCEALLFAASRAQLCKEIIQPTLEAGTNVLLDRFVDSSLVYQGIARQLGIEQIAQINDFATGGLKPGLTVLLDLDAKTAISRTAGTDRMEQEGIDFFKAVADGYRNLAANQPNRFAVIDAMQTPDKVLDQTLLAITNFLSLNAPFVP